MNKYLTIKCPRCGHASVFDVHGLDEDDARMLVATEYRVCRRCGTTLIDAEQYDEYDVGPEEEQS